MNDYKIQREIVIRRGVVLQEEEMKIAMSLSNVILMKRCKPGRLTH
jgi:hypothetical protein